MQRRRCRQTIQPRSNAQRQPTSDSKPSTSFMPWARGGLTAVMANVGSTAAPAAERSKRLPARCLPFSIAGPFECRFWGNTKVARRKFATKNAQTSCMLTTKIEVPASDAAVQNAAPSEQPLSRNRRAFAVESYKAKNSLKSRTSDIKVVPPQQFELALFFKALFVVQQICPTISRSFDFC